MAGAPLPEPEGFSSGGLQQTSLLSSTTSGDGRFAPLDLTAPTLSWEGAGGGLMLGNSVASTWDGERLPPAGSLELTASVTMVGGGGGGAASVASASAGGSRGHVIPAPALPSPIGSKPLPPSRSALGGGGGGFGGGEPTPRSHAHGAERFDVHGEEPTGVSFSTGLVPFEGGGGGESARNGSSKRPMSVESGGAHPRGSASWRPRPPPRARSQMSR